MSRISGERVLPFYGLRPNTCNSPNPMSIVMHPGPINRGREILVRGGGLQSSAILNQVENGMAVRMAVLERVLAA